VHQFTTQQAGKGGKRNEFFSQHKIEVEFAQTCSVTMELVNKWHFARTWGHLLVLAGDYSMHRYAPMITHGEVQAHYLLVFEVVAKCLSMRLLILQSR